MQKLLKIRGFVAMPIIIISAVLAVGVLGGLAYEYKNNQSILSSINKNNLLAGISSIIETPYLGKDYQIKTLIGGSYGNGGDNLVIVLQLTNTSSAIKAFTFNSGCYANYSISSSDGKLIYDSGAGKFCIQAVTSFTLQPNEDKFWKFDYYNAVNLSSGDYTITGSLSGYGQATTKITIVAPSITVTSPNGGEKFSAGTYMPISWSSQNYPSYAGVDVNLFKKKSSPILSALTLGLYDEYDFNAPIVRNYANKYGQGPINWTIPADYSSGEYKLEVSCSRNQGYGYGYGQNCISDVSDESFTITERTLPIARGITIIGNQPTYSPGQDIKFSVKAIASDGFAGGPDRGFNVSSWIQTSSGEIVYVNGVVQSVNATFNPSTNYWDVPMTAPSDDSKTYLVYLAFYCSNPGSGCVSNQISEQFTFTLGGGKLTQEELKALITILMSQIQSFQNQLQNSETQAQIAALLAQIQSLQSQLQATSVCDSLSKSIVDAVGGCSTIDQTKYSNIYQACCTKVTKETLLSMLNSYLGDGVIDSSEKTALLTALNSYLQ